VRSATCASEVREEPRPGEVAAGDGQAEPERPRRRRAWVYVVVGAVVAAILGWLIYSGLLVQAVRFESNLDTESMREAIQSLGPAAPLASIGLMILHTYVPFPLEILALANGLVFGAWGGIAITWFSMILSAWIGYATTRFARPLAYKITSGERLERMEAWTARRSTWQLVAIRFVPVISFSLLNLAMGLLRVPFWTFTWTTALGIIPIVVVSVVAGNLLHLGPVAWGVIGGLIAAYLGWEIWRHTRVRLRSRRARKGG
jgi:uncharacterized membrane protein YdjX (TVP38/TMEM64 family)